ncbi:Helix-turn-helix domain-containing protein [Streptoalloteichus tenebrarius]|uniref:Helix-turn-helix domain-containing protein n=1 Tax=Streptoalloteichus tenebrarius (strain ATCC 17920 / DSM 40477 / JCM 4838 / CBS 697.72 / NBRC 16177 / NCIMB 11028 / NRRL B-12390 / A12253. 1 / ISP 5477) TaxID=1933 RepID=A0ABT1HY80_STRSD|nr:helix-turn-helix transcriptional regulator [Streptoalloteichus tenebrarius]MCP2260315.1 Helix-turn-helix domain-containing protein [Streptoalloteichus tenebrarius]BFF03065.1 helix-turn-helix transcriptional regulator [Streptoalloteichus tenebrarius]
MAEAFKPSVRLRRVGRVLRQWRERAGMKGKGLEVARSLGWSQAKLSRLENATQPINPVDVLALGLVYQIPEDERDALFLTTQNAQQRGWWEEYGCNALFDAAQDFVELESEASLLRSYKVDLVPGLLQTEEYATSLARADVPAVSEETARQRAAVRVTRQKRLYDGKPLRVEAVVSESALRQVVGGPRVMREQLERLITLAELPHVVIQIMPFDVGAYPAMGSTFDMLSFDQDHHDDVVYLESLTQGQYVEDPEVVSVFTLNFESMREVALDEDASRKLIADVAESLA